MAPRYEQLPLELWENILGPAENFQSFGQHSFEEKLRDSLDRPNIEKLLQTLSTQKTITQVSQQELTSGSNHGYGINLGDGHNQERVNPVVQQSRNCLTILNNWWSWGIDSILPSLFCLAAIIILLAVIHEKPLLSWRFPIAPNDSTLATMSKASLMLSVAACISRMKWLYFKHGTHRPNDLQLFDQASRGPLGALELLAGILGGRSRASQAAMWGSVITIVALAVDPFAQQILSFPSRQTSLSLGSASIKATQIYDSGNPGGVTDPEGKNVDISMQGAIMNGMYSLESPVNFNCQIANCTWPTFYSLGICSTCTNVTNIVNNSCVSGNHASTSVDDESFNSNCTFTVNLNTIANFVATFFTTSNQDATARALWTSPNISQTMRNFTTSMTNNIREDGNATNTEGTAAQVETYIRVL
ncbi:uncharacterized protein PAC_12599 [Phialocephala subalpina]|uniref:Uncharacterized protein n=1 Tax=Phialocephala subalpina TaxID=576137 RepID=A0A1L7XCF7_9HELO|nr:uncharacterized protein PAC_12599 [Phialocephala subalpina]